LGLVPGGLRKQAAGFSFTPAAGTGPRRLDAATALGEVLPETERGVL